MSCFVLFSYSDFNPTQWSNPERVGDWIHYSDVITGTMASQITSLTRLFTQPFIQAQIIENIKALRHWPLWGEFTAQRASNVKNVSIWWRHHARACSNNIWYNHDKQNNVYKLHGMYCTFVPSIELIEGFGCLCISTSLPAGIFRNTASPAWDVRYSHAAHIPYTNGHAVHYVTDISIVVTGTV